MGRFLELEQWKRRDHYELYRGMPRPWFSITVEVEVTRLWLGRHQPGAPSFFLAAIFLAMQAANRTEPFRLRLREKGVWVHDQVDASTTILRADETFAFAQFTTRDRFDEYQRLGREEIERARARTTLGVQPGRDDVIYHSTVPWLRFTAFSNPLSTADDSIPRLVFGKCFEAGGRWHMPVAIEVHHALMDGLDLARFVDRFQQGLDAPLPGYAEGT